MESIILLGGGGHCKSVIDTILSSNLYNIIGVIDVKEKIGEKVLRDIKIIDSDENLYKYKEQNINNVFVTVGSIGNPRIRIKLYENAKKNGFIFPNIIDETAIISENAEIGQGTFVGKGVIINAEAIIGDNCIINTGSVIEHDCYIGDFVHLSPNTTLCGGVKVGKNSHIGANSTIIQYKNIGKNVIVGAGSIVTKDIADNITAYGNPCREAVR
ncbi:acetyltransferase [Clostridium butyricum]|uniref:acetyltransferase n=1 Tax=Clostridium butyricum TaxID=1492 RepID=UPI0029134164|nr:acetyltransferase [Clostridium butyricum]MDU3594172.1 acetyltransferase [Clostridium butyricum]